MQLLSSAPTSKVIGVRDEAQNGSFTNSITAITHPEPIIENCNPAQTTLLRHALYYIHLELLKVYRSAEEGIRDRAFAAFFKDSRNTGLVTKLLAHMMEQKPLDGGIDRRIRFVCVNGIPAVMHKCTPDKSVLFGSDPPTVYICPALFQLPLSPSSPTCPAIRNNRFAAPAGGRIVFRSTQRRALVGSLLVLCKGQESSQLPLPMGKLDALNRAMQLGPNVAARDRQALFVYTERTLSSLFQRIALFQAILSITVADFDFPVKMDECHEYPDPRLPPWNFPGLLAATGLLAANMTTPDMVTTS